MMIMMMIRVEPNLTISMAAPDFSSGSVKSTIQTFFQKSDHRTGIFQIWLQVWLELDLAGFQNNGQIPNLPEPEIWYNLNDDD